MKGPLPVVLALALALGLSACAPAPASSSAPAASATTDTAAPAPAQEAAPAASTGGIRGNDNLQQDGVMRYSVYVGNPTEEGFSAQVLALDCTTGQQTVLYAPEEPVQQTGTPFARNGTVYLFADRTMYRIPAGGGTAETVALSEVFYPTSADDTAAYSLYFEQGANNYVGKRLDLETGAITPLTLPAQTYGIWAVNEPQVFLCRLVTDSPLPGLEEGEMYAAALQNAVCEYGWYDLGDGSFRKVAEEPYYGVEQPDGTTRRRSFEGMAGGRLYFVWRQIGTDGATLQAGIESCDFNGEDWQPVADLPQRADAVWTLEQNDQLRWILGQTSGLWVYDLADGQLYELQTVNAASDRWPSALTGNDRVLVSADVARYGDRFAMMEISDFLADRTDCIPLDLCGKPMGII